MNPRLSAVSIDLAAARYADSVVFRGQAWCFWPGTRLHRLWLRMYDERVAELAGAGAH